MSSPGDAAAVHDYTSLQPTYVNHTAVNGTYAVLTTHLVTTDAVAASGEYTEVPDVVASAVTSTSSDNPQSYEVPQPTVLDDWYEGVISHELPHSSYLYVPTKVSV